MRMLSWSKHFLSLRRRRAWLQLNSYRQETGNYLNGVNALMHNAFCTVTESPTTDESPELPDWVKSSDEDMGANKQEDEEFMPPSISSWIENHKICAEHSQHTDVNRIVNQAKDIDVKNIVNDIVESDIDKVSKILKIPLESPNLVVKALDGCAVDVSDGLVEHVLRRFSCEWKPGFGFFKWGELRKGVKHSPALYNLMIDNLGKAKKFDIIWELVEDMKKLEGYVTLDTMTKIMRRLAKARKYEDAVKIFETLELFGVEKDITAMNILMDAFVKEGSIEQAESVFSKYKESIPPMLHTYNILVHGWCKIRQIDKAKKTIDEMKLHGFQPDTITYTYFIEAYCREKDFRKVESTLEEMKENGCHPSVVTYTIIMNALAIAKEINRALKVYEKMKETNCLPDAAFYTVFIKALSLAGRLKDADTVFEDMSKQGVVPDVWTYNALIFIAAQDSQEEKALKLLMKLEESGCKPDLNTYVPLLKMCCMLNRMKVLSFLLSHMFQNNVSLDLGTYSLLIGRLCKSGNPKRACFYFKELLDKGFVPMDCTYDTLINELEKKGMCEEKREIEELLLSKNFIRMTPVKKITKADKRRASRAMAYSANRTSPPYL